MKPPPFAYHRPETPEEVDRLLAEHGDEAKILAGGQSLLPILNMRLSAPAHLIDINRLRRPAGASRRSTTAWCASRRSSARAPWSAGGSWPRRRR